MLKFVVALAFHSQIATPLVNTDVKGRLAYDAAQTKGDA